MKKTNIWIASAFALTTLFPIGSIAADKPASEKKSTEAPAEGEVDISDVQNQYWKAHDKQLKSFKINFTQKPTVSNSALCSVFIKE